MSRKLNKLLGKAEEHLDSDEEVIKAVVGTYETKIMGNDSVRKGLLAATNHRLIFYAKKRGGSDLESFPYVLEASSKSRGPVSESSKAE